MKYLVRIVLFIKLRKGAAYGLYREVFILIFFLAPFVLVVLSQGEAFEFEKNLKKKPVR